MSTEKVKVEMKSTVKIEMPGYTDLHWALFRLILNRERDHIPGSPDCIGIGTGHEPDNRYALLEFNDQKITPEKVDDIESWIRLRLFELEHVIINYNLLLNAGILGLPAKGEDHQNKEDIGIEELGLNSHVCRALTHEGLLTVGNLLNRGTEGLIVVRNIGQKSLGEVKQKLALLGLELKE